MQPEEAEDVHVACIRTHLISGASAVSLVPRSEDRLLSSSLRSFSGPPRFLLCPGLTQPVLCCFNSVPEALSHSILRLSLRLLRCLRGSLREHDCAISNSLFSYLQVKQKRRQWNDDCNMTTALLLDIHPVKVGVSRFGKW